MTAVRLLCLEGRATPLFRFSGSGHKYPATRKSGVKYTQ